MTKKRKAPSNRDLNEPKVFDPNDGKLDPIRTYEDVANSEDEFHLIRDKVMLEDGPDAKRRKNWEEEDAFLEGSDEEILGYSTSEDDIDDEDDEDEQNDLRIKSKSQSKSKTQAAPESDASQDEDEDARGWGSSTRDYYGADALNTEADALEEEVEIKRLQHKKLQKMTEADFGFDENDWLETADADQDGEVSTEVLKDVAITPQMSQEERLRILQTRYPELEFLANELLRLQPILVDLQVLRKGPGNRLSVLKLRALTAYVGSLSMYFAILTSTAREGSSPALALDPIELRDHTVMESLLACRELWSRVKDVKEHAAAKMEELKIMTSPDLVEILEISKPKAPESNKKSENKRFRDSAALKALQSRSARLQVAEADLADLSSLIPLSKKSRNSKAVPKENYSGIFEDSNSDFGEETHLDARSAAEKAQKKKSLRFYTSQIAQKSNRRTDAGRDAGGDADLPYRERLRDRQARLNAEAEKRGKKLDSYGRGTDLDGADSGDEDAAVADQVRDDEDEYYDLVTRKSSDKKNDKREKYDAIAAAKAANGLVRVVEGEMDKNGKRAIGYVISKNKGLAPKRKKEVRNPRVKKRMKYEEKIKKLSSVRAVYKGGEGRGGYGGEKTGIKTGLIKSIKL